MSTWLSAFPLCKLPQHRHALTLFWFFCVIDPRDIALILSSSSEQGSLKSPLAFSCDAVKRAFSLKPKVTQRQLQRVNAFCNQFYQRRSQARSTGYYLTISCQSRGFFSSGSWMVSSAIKLFISLPLLHFQQSQSPLPAPQSWGHCEVPSWLYHLCSGEKPSSGAESSMQRESTARRG